MNGVFLPKFLCCTIFGSDFLSLEKVGNYDLGLYFKRVTIFKINIDVV